MRALGKVLRLAALVTVTLFVAEMARSWDVVERVFLGGLKIYETSPPPLPRAVKRPAILVFSKTNGYRHQDAIAAANVLFAQMATDRGWGHVQTQNAAVFNRHLLARFDAVVFNNVSGDVFTPLQRQAFRQWLTAGGALIAIHAAGDGSHGKWPWYRDEVIGARFTQHTLWPQFQTATVLLENRGHPLAAGLPSQWRHLEEWYSFESPPRRVGYSVIAVVDEKTYVPKGMFGSDIAMGKDHPVVWIHRVGRGRVFYSALGHRAEAFAEPEYRTLLNNAAVWAVHNNLRHAADFHQLHEGRR